MLSKIFAGIAAKVLLGLLVATLLGGGIVWAGKNRTIKKQAAEIALYQSAIKDYKVAVATLRGNQAVLQSGLTVCNASITNLAATRDALSKAGVSALNNVKAAGRAVAERAARLDKMPAATCDDALAILKAGG